MVDTTKISELNDRIGAKRQMLADLNTKLDNLEENIDSEKIALLELEEELIEAEADNLPDDDEDDGDDDEGIE